MKKKVAIITCIGKSNFGNRLQNYALQKVLEDYNFDVETLINTSLLNNIENYEESLKEYESYKEEKEKRDYENRHRIAYFEEFDKNVIFANDFITAKNLPETNYDYYIVGSDQIWNPYHGKLRDLDLLYCIEPSKRISYAASIGIDEIPMDFKDKTKKELSKFKAISVREDKGKELLEKLTGRQDIQVNLDPTMLLTDKEWSELAKRPKQLKTDKYILNYFLGKLSPEREAEIERIARENDCEIINILDKEGPFYETGPSEFLYLEQNAFLICTDSFHSSVFALLFNRPFIIFNREDSQASMNSRLETLVNTFKLENRNFYKNITEENLKHNYTNAYKILEEERKKAHNYLNNALNKK
jgi:hypothetical protein